MVVSTPSFFDAFAHWNVSAGQQSAVHRGEILLHPQVHPNGGGSATAQMYLPMARDLAWSQLTNYSRWVHYFTDITNSRLLAVDADNPACKRIYQMARKAFLFLTAEVEIYLRVMERSQQKIEFRLERGNFVDFSADLYLQDWQAGTLMTYSVCATPSIPVPSFVVQQALQLELPANMRNMRRTLCPGS